MSMRMASRFRAVSTRVSPLEMLDALVEALDNGQIAAAGLDVLTDESRSIEDSPLIGRPNVILTPHVAFYSDRSILENRRLSASNIRNFLDGRHDQVRKYIHRAEPD